MKRTVSMILLLLISGLNATQLEILYSDHVSAILTDCHCPEDSLGGLIHRVTYIDKQRNEYPDLLLLDAGGWSNGSRDNMNDNSFVLPFYSLMKYDAIGLGVSELKLGEENLISLIENKEFPVIASNLLRKEDRKPVTRQFIITERKGSRIAILSIIEPSLGNKLLDKFYLDDPANALKPLIQELRQKADFIILLTQSDISFSIALGEQFRDINLVIESFTTAPFEKPIALESNGYLVSYGSGEGFGFIKTNAEKNKGFTEFNQKFVPVYRNLEIKSEAKELYEKALKKADAIEIDSGRKKSCSEKKGEKILIRYFYSRTCKYCMEVTDKIIPEIIREFPLCILFYDISNTSDYKKLVYEEQELRVKRLDIPAFTFRDGYIHGEKEVNLEKLKEEIRKRIQQ
ncbi:MAG: hypothetical protein JXA60_09010 [Candidatus Coatesbacteria bacterium]|nr:hypothetical protein [Candidatus Coatesbacteria bacterium]